ncbi:hypothetical protein AGMMS49992_04530 [Clostridia bacterium]|nr:hypothetical protein AGMMS49992_04530 [Clostridia bacterium]
MHGGHLDDDLAVFQQVEILLHSFREVFLDVFLEIGDGQLHRSIPPKFTEKMVDSFRTEKGMRVSGVIMRDISHWDVIISNHFTL